MKFEKTIYINKFKRKDFFLIVTILISISGIYGWYAGKYGFASFSLVYIPSAPATSFVFLALSLLLLLIIHFDKSKFIKITSTILTLCILFFCSLIFLDFIFDFTWDAENFIVFNPEIVGTIPIGRMSPITSLLFIFNCIGILGIKQFNYKIYKYISGFLSLFVFIVSSVLLMGYLYNVPFLYGSNIIPVALPASFCSFFFSITLLQVYTLKFWSFNIIGENIIKRQLLKSFLPIVILIIIVQGYLITNFSLRHQHPALTSALIILIAIFVTILMVLRISELLGKQIQKVEISLRKNEEKLRSITQTANDAIITTDITGNILGWNSGAEKIFGYKEPEITGQSLTIIIPDEYIEQHINGIKRIGSGGDKHVIGSTVELNGLNKNGIVFPIELSLSEWKISEGTFYTGIIRDISERKRTELIIQNKNKELQELNVTKDKFFSIIAHDLKGPLAVMIGLSDIIIDNFDSYDKKKIENLVTSLNTVANRTYSLLENLLEWSRLQRGMITADLKENNLKTIVNSICLLFSEMAFNKNIALHNHVFSDIYAYCDVNMTNTILRNLVSNAIKFTDSNGFVSINAFQRGTFIEIQVIDTGLGIPLENIPFMFSIEKDISAKGTKGEKGSGLGLLLCKEFVEKQGGRIWVESEMGKGSTFYFTLKYLA